jgi:hypothetical protein
MATDLADGTGSELHVVYMGRVPDSPRGLRITERHLDRAVYEDMER